MAKLALLGGLIGFVVGWLTWKEVTQLSTAISLAILGASLASLLEKSGIPG